jgi:hypothetical protein
MASPAQYSNLAIVKPVKRTAGALKAAASAERDREAIVKTKVDRLASVLDRHEARRFEATAAVKAWEARVKFLEQRQAAVEERVLTLMTEAGLKELAGFKRTLTKHECATPSLVVDDESKIPSVWMRQPKLPKKQPDKNGMKAALEADPDLEIPGVSLAHTVSLLRK